MKQITVISGKGGTGKTTLVASFAALADRLVVTDCDVDAPDLHLLLQPKILKTQEFKGSKLAVRDESKCQLCGRCETLCRFNAIKNFKLDPILCEGCGLCAYACPAEAITMEERIAGYAYVSETRYGSMSHALLNPGQENSGKLVSLVRKNAEHVAEKENCELILNDGSPGIGCPVIASIGGVDLCLIVVEPTLSGIHDMERALGLLKHFEIQPLICVNKYDINVENTHKIIEFCESEGVKVAGEIPFDSLVTKAMVAGEPVVKYSPKSLVSRDIAKLWKQILKQLNVNP